LETGLFNNIVTFRKEDATIQFPTFKAGASGDIRFHFKTTAMDGILLQNTGQFDFIEVRLVCESYLLHYFWLINIITINIIIYYYKYYYYKYT